MEKQHSLQTESILLPECLQNLESAREVASVQLRELEQKIYRIKVENERRERINKYQRLYDNAKGFLETKAVPVGVTLEKDLGKEVNERAYAQASNKVSFALEKMESVDFWHGCARDIGVNYSVKVVDKNNEWFTEAVTRRLPLVDKLTGEADRSVNFSFTNLYLIGRQSWLSESVGRSCFLMPGVLRLEHGWRHGYDKTEEGDGYDNHNYLLNEQEINSQTYHMFMGLELSFKYMGYKIKGASREN